MFLQSMWLGALTVLVGRYFITEHGEVQPARIEITRGQPMSSLTSCFVFEFVIGHGLRNLEVIV